jgi:hypothetical protein
MARQNAACMQEIIHFGDVGVELQKDCTSRLLRLTESDGHLPQGTVGIVLDYCRCQFSTYILQLHSLRRDKKHVSRQHSYFVNEGCHGD